MLIITFPPFNLVFLLCIFAVFVFGTQINLWCELSCFVKPLKNARSASTLPKKYIYGRIDGGPFSRYVLPAEKLPFQVPKHGNISDISEEKFAVMVLYL